LLGGYRYKRAIEMGKVLTVMNMKGGVGKTTVAIHLAGILSKGSLGKRVLAIDYDPQFNLSQAFIPAKTYFALEKARKTTIAILLDNDTMLDPYQIQVPGNHNPPKLIELVTHLYSKTAHSAGSLDIIPSTLDLMYVALGQADAKTKPMEERFGKFIEECRPLYDLILIDCHPAGSLFTKTSLRNSDDVLIPVVAESSYAIRGIGLMMNFIKAKKIGEKSPTPHILLNMAPRFGSTAKERSIRANPEVAGFCMTNPLKRYKAFSEPEGGKGFVWDSGKP
jgi:chromosome partitioning protein